jgi:hypothetical protein
MSDRPFLKPNTVIPIINGVSMASSITGTPQMIQTLPGMSYDIVWTGTPTGTFQVQVSNTYQQASDGTVIAAGNWTTLPTSAFTGTYPVPSGSASNGFIDVVGTEAYAVRLVYTASGGSGNLTVVASAKVL